MSAVSGRKFHKSEQQQQQQIYQPNGINQQNEELTPRRMAKKMLSPYMYLVRSSLGQEEENKRKSPNKQHELKITLRLFDNEELILIKRKNRSSSENKQAIPKLPFEVHYNHEQKRKRDNLMNNVKINGYSCRNSLKQTPEKKKLSIQQLQSTQDATTATNTTTTLKKKKQKISPENNINNNNINSNNINVSDYNAERSDAIETFKALSNSGASVPSKRKKSPLREVLEDRNQDLEKERLVMIGCITKIKELREKYFGPSEAFFIDPNENAKHSFDKEYCALELCISQQQQQAQLQQMDTSDNPQISKREVDKRMAEKEYVIQELQKAIQSANSELSAISNELIIQRQAAMDKQVQITQLADSNMKFQKSLQEYKKLEEYGTMNEIVQKEIESLKAQKNDFEKKYNELKSRVQTLQGLKEENTMLKLELDHRVKDLKIENEKILREYSMILKEHTFFRAKCKQLDEDLEESNRKNQSLLQEKRTWQMNSLKVPANKGREEEIQTATLDGRMDQQQQRRYNTEGLQARQIDRAKNGNNNNNTFHNINDYQQQKGYPQDYTRGIKQQQQQQTLQPQQQQQYQESRLQKDYGKGSSSESRDGSRIRSNNNNNGNGIIRNPVGQQNRQLIINESANSGQRDNFGRNDEESRKFSSRLQDKKREQSAGREGIRKNKEEQEDNSSISSNNYNNRMSSREKPQQSQIRGNSSKRAASQQPQLKNERAGGESGIRSRETSLINDIQQSMNNSIRVPAGYQFTQQKKDNKNNNINSNGRSSISNPGYQQQTQQNGNDRNQSSLIKEIPIQINISPIKNKEQLQQKQQQLSRLEDQETQQQQQYESPQRNNSIKAEQIYQQQGESSKEVSPQTNSGLGIRQQNKLSTPAALGERGGNVKENGDVNDSNINNMNGHNSSSHFRASQAAYELRTLTLEEKMEELQKTNEELRERIEHQEKMLLSYQRDRQDQGRQQPSSYEIIQKDSIVRNKNIVLHKEDEKKSNNVNSMIESDNDGLDHNRNEKSSSILENGMKNNLNDDQGNILNNNVSLHGQKSSSMSVIQGKEGNRTQEKKDNYNKSAVIIQQQEFSFDEEKQQQQQYLQVNNSIINKGSRNPSKLQESEEIQDTEVDQQQQRQAQGRADQALVGIDNAGESRASRNSNI